MLEKAYIIHNPIDNVGIAIKDINAGQDVSCASMASRGEQIRIKDSIPFGHKFALRPIASGDKIMRYGECIGIATFSIETGEHVHIHNVKSARCHKD
ncbi:MAG: Altronate dehydratase [Firmicutes bacterium ADurb.Bin153]|nr:MAG: Altronate dehydratase [Firmicutes bacterium ADurb.Bin153]